MAQTIASYSAFPHTERITLGDTPLATKVSLPDVPYPVEVSIKPITNTARLGGKNVGIADGAALSASYNTLVADQWNSLVIPGSIKGVSPPELYIASGTSATVVEISIVAVSK